MGFPGAVWWPTEPLTISVGQIYHLHPKKALVTICIMQLIGDVFCKSKIDQNNSKSMRIRYLSLLVKSVYSSWGTTDICPDPGGPLGLFKILSSP